MRVEVADGDVVISDGVQMLTLDPAKKVVTSVMQRFELDPPIDATTFSTTAPDAYTLETKQVDVTLAAHGKVAEAVVAVLKSYVAGSGGAFPKGPNDWTDLIGRDAMGAARVDPQTIGAMAGQLFSLPNGYGYAGKGVTLGEADKIVFWYRPANATTYRAVFGDLRIEDVAADRIPATQPTK